MNARPLFHAVLVLFAVLAGYGLIHARVQENRFTVFFGGDILLANESRRTIVSRGIDYPFNRIKEELLKYDLIFANLEVPITDRGAPVTGKPYVFRLDPAEAQCLRDLKIDAVSIANNHLLDYGVVGMDDTIASLDTLNVRRAGAGKNLAEARRPAILSCRGVRICILAYCNRPPASYYATDSGPGIAPLDLAMIRDDIAAWKSDSSVVIVSLHWGIEHTHEPQTSQVRDARAIIDAGADAVIGHHPHWPQGIEMYRGRPIAYSLGNFIGGYYNPVERDNIALVLYFSGVRLERIRVIPIAGRNSAIRFQPFVLRGPAAAATLTLVRNLSRKLGTDIDIADNNGFIDPPDTDIGAFAGTRRVTPRGPAGPKPKTGNK